jgi:hypothetical protein
MHYLESSLDEVQAIFAAQGIIPLKAEMEYHDMCIHYTAYSEAFPAIDEGEQIPSYDLVIDGSADRITDCRFEKI